MSKSETPETPFMRALPTPWQGGDVIGPQVSYGELGALLRFTVPDGEGRVTFEKFDSLRISRGESEPFESDWEAHEVIPWVYIVDRSPYLLERYAYEAKFYGRSYEFNGDVDEMLTDFDHYVFMFKDNFVEAIAGGIWLQATKDALGDGEGFDDHPLADLPTTCIQDQVNACGLSVDIRVNPRPVEELVRDAVFCSQPLIQVTSEEGLSTLVNWRLSLRSRNGKVRSILRNGLGRVEKRYRGIVGLEEIRPVIEQWLAQVRQRRKAIGKD